MKLEFDKQKMMLAHVNVRSEIHGEERQGAADLKFHVILQNDCLAMFHPYLKTALYMKGGKGNDLADAGSDAPNLRMDGIEWPMKWKGEMKGAKLVVRMVGLRENLTWSDAKINGARITAKDSGIVDLIFRAQVYPNEEQAGKLFAMMQKEVSVSIEPGTEEEVSGKE